MTCREKRHNQPHAIRVGRDLTVPLICGYLPIEMESPVPGDRFSYIYDVGILRSRNPLGCVIQSMVPVTKEVDIS